MFKQAVCEVLGGSHSNRRMCVCVCRHALSVNTVGWCKESLALLLLLAVLRPNRLRCLISERTSILLSPLIGKSRVKLRPRVPASELGPRIWTRYACAMQYFVLVSGSL